MNISLPYLPNRPNKPRNEGITMVMDKGLSLNETANFIEKAGEYTDLVKLGFGTCAFSPRLKEKIKLYKSAGLIPYLGGTLFEAYAVRNMIDQYLCFVESLGLEMCEISDGSMVMEHETKLECIMEISRHFVVVSEVGSKQKDVVITENKWVEMMLQELNAGSWKVIAEARESGNVGIYNSDASANISLINNIANHLDKNNILWEAPIKTQQVWFIKQYGPNVNLGNIAPDELVSLECLRQGLRGDTFSDFIPASAMHSKPEITKLSKFHNQKLSSKYYNLEFVI
jgi:phosphosulfolactate synthase